MLPQLAVSAKILCLLMVVVCGALQSTERMVFLFNQCSRDYVNVFANGVVTARTTPTGHSNLTIIGDLTASRINLLIYSRDLDRYLCFNRSRLMAQNMSRRAAKRQHNCLFNELFVDGYNRYHLIKNTDRYIGFNSQGNLVHRALSRLPPRHHRCLSFIKETTDFDITRHNNKLAGESPKWRHQRRLRPMSTFVKPVYHRVRHHHGRHKRRRLNEV